MMLRGLQEVQSGTRRALIWTPGREAENKDGKDYGKTPDRETDKAKRGTKKSKDQGC